MLKLGAHQSIVGGLDKAIERVVKIGGNCLQIFSSSPRRWSFAHLTDKQVNDFIKKGKKFSVSPIYFHASYLTNLADDDKIGRLSKQSLIHELNLSQKLKIKGSIVHLGSYKKQVESIK
jgi:deoxyribonuclease-4